MFLLDTNICIHYLNGTVPEVTRRVLDAGPEVVAVSTLTGGELHYGAARSSRPEANRRRLAVFFRELTLVPFDAACGERLGRIKAELAGEGQPIPDFDLAIAATALTTGRILVSEDRRHMPRVPGLQLERWLS